MDTIPNYYEFKIPMEIGREVIIGRPYSGPAQYRTFDSAPSNTWTLGAEDASFDEFTAMRTFWMSKYPGVSFYLWDPQMNETRVYDIISNFTPQYNIGDSYGWKFQIREVFPYTVISGPPPP